MRQDLTTKPDSSDGNFELSHETVTSNGSSEVRGIHTETVASSEHTWCSRPLDAIPSYNI